jgi:hypothetical protein
LSFETVLKRAEVLIAIACTASNTGIRLYEVTHSQAYCSLANRHGLALNVCHSLSKMLTSIIVCGMLLLLYTVWLLLLLSALGPHTTCRQPSCAWQKLRCVGAAPCRCDKNGC